MVYMAAKVMMDRSKASFAINNLVGCIVALLTRTRTRTRTHVLSNTQVRVTRQSSCGTVGLELLFKTSQGTAAKSTASTSRRIHGTLQRRAATLLFCGMLKQEQLFGPESLQCTPGKWLACTYQSSCSTLWFMVRMTVRQCC